MNVNNQYQTFSTRNRFLSNSDNQEIEIPNFITKAYKRYRYNYSETVIERQCYKCQKWFAILKFENGVFSDIHLESQYHFCGSKSGFGSYCVSCNKPTTIVNDNLSGCVKYSIFLTKENMKYVGMRCSAQDISKRIFFNELIEQEKLKNPITKFI